jgi:hypothetical protein
VAKESESVEELVEALADLDCFLFRRGEDQKVVDER